MKRSLPRALTLAFITFLLGSVIDYLTGLETTLGLDALFRIRGIRTPPAEVVVVAMDETSETRLKVGQDLTRWRSFHAKLIQELQRQNATLIVFDLQFAVPHPDHDPSFATAMREAGNVLLIDCVQKLRRGVEDFYGRDECAEINKKPFVQKEGVEQQPLSEQLIAMRKMSPTPVLTQSALDHAPFYLTNDPENNTIREVWTFLDALAETPTLPVLTWFYYLQRTGALQDITQPSILLSDWLIEQRRQCQSGLEKTSTSSLKNGELKDRIDNIICLEDSRYLDFYGPPKTVRMESYSDVYEGNVTDLKGKVVFIGKANRKFSPGKTDYFQTPFTSTQSGNMAGVEIMATQFANLLEGRFIKSPLPPGLLILIFGLTIGLLLTRFNGVPGLMASFGVGTALAGLAVWCFNRSGMWLPVAVPLLIQLPVAWLISLLWSRRDLLKERKRILAFVRRVFPQWMPFVPASPGQWDPEKGTAEMTSEREVHGICFATDIEGYTTVAAKHPPHEMWELLKAYYQVLGYPVSANDGIIANIQGDAMMALWIDLPQEIQRQSACLAALEIEQAVERFNSTSPVDRLPTRIGLHEGDMVLGSGESGEFRFYNPFGDTLNTASRIEGVNKYLGTRILASAAIASSLTQIVTRPVGTFRLVGKNEPMDLVEIVGKESEVTESKKQFYEKFADSLALFRHGKWLQASSSLRSLLNVYGHDGPTSYYLEWADSYQQNPPLEWNGIMTLGGK